MSELNHTGWLLGLTVEGIKCGKVSLIVLLRYDHTYSISSEKKQGVKSKLFTDPQLPLEKFRIGVALWSLLLLEDEQKSNVMTKWSDRIGSGSSQCIRWLKRLSVKTKSRMLPATCIGSSIIWVRLRLKTTSQKSDEKGDWPLRESQLMSLTLKSPYMTSKILKGVNVVHWWYSFEESGGI